MHVELGAHRSPDAGNLRRAWHGRRLWVSAHAAVEMPSPWTSQTEAHRDLEISPRPARFHIPTADRSSRRSEPDKKSVTDVSGLICYRCFRLRGVQGSGFKGSRVQGSRVQGFREFGVRGSGFVGVLGQECGVPAGGGLALAAVEVAGSDVIPDIARHQRCNSWSASVAPKCSTSVCRPARDFASRTASPARFRRISRNWRGWK